jgi:hypothetical protein
MTGPQAEQAAILQILIRQGGIGLTGNRESWSDISRDDIGWLRRDGDPMTGEETRSRLTDDEVLRAVFWKARDRLGHYGPDDGRVTWADVLAWLQAGSP